MSPERNAASCPPITAITWLRTSDVLALKLPGTAWLDAGHANANMPSGNHTIHFFMTPIMSSPKNGATSPGHERDSRACRRRPWVFSASFLFCAKDWFWCGLTTMSTVPPPNESLAELASVLGEDNGRTLVTTFLRDFPQSFKKLDGGERKNRHRAAHSMKSNSRLMGAYALSERMAELEARLEKENGPDVTPGDLDAIAAEFETVAGPLRAFAGV